MEINCCVKCCISVSFFCRDLQIHCFEHVMSNIAVSARQLHYNYNLKCTSKLYTSNFVAVVVNVICSVCVITVYCAYGLDFLDSVMCESGGNQIEPSRK